jgi:hypothetical protein
MGDKKKRLWKEVQVGEEVQVSLGVERGVARVSRTGSSSALVVEVVVAGFNPPHKGETVYPPDDAEVTL